jgi:hypothetical protein
VTDAEKIAALEEALAYAIQIIESYQADIHDSAEAAERAAELGTSLAAAGFCQGSIYQEAIEDIRWRAAGSPPRARVRAVGVRG